MSRLWAVSMSVSLTSTPAPTATVFRPWCIEYGPSATATGASLTWVSVIVNCWVGLKLTSPPPFGPLSTTWTVIVATPAAFAAPVNVKSPAGEMAGATANRAAFELLSMT